MRPRVSRVRRACDVDRYRRGGSFRSPRVLFRLTLSRYVACFLSLSMAPERIQLVQTMIFFGVPFTTTRTR